ncbi:MAG: LytTR family DNA-binding domain-containing protein [Lachnospiraceae bacterium]|nr:LytTR family DNA-binding domain-containing protein [Lachnospiraceae bacterium]MDE6186473.1 LytTR family DNA-binding domain-containing protein [Lachnospiraceae bacterium]
MLRIAVCDDIPIYVDMLADGIEAWADEKHFNVQLEKFASGEEVLFGQEAAGDYAVVFMDIELEGIDGMETAMKLRERNRMVSIVFVSQYEQYFKQMFKIYPFRYIEKPVSKQKVGEVLDQIVEEHRLFYESFFFQYNRRNFHIALGEVFYFVSERRVIRILMENDKEYVFYEKLDDLEKILADYNNRFIRIHQSYLVNGRQIEQYLPGYVVMRNGDTLPVSRDKKGKITEFYMDFLEEKC